MDLTAVLAGCVGAILVWSAIKNKHPLDVIKLSLQGQSLDGARPLNALAAPAPAQPGVTAPQLPNGGN
jgi:hypothetical protein